MSLEWFDRVSGELQDHLESICDKYDQVGQMSIEKGARHPRIEFFIETEDEDREYFCTLYFDPTNDEFYIETLDLDLDLTARTILPDIEDIIDVVHESFHDFVSDNTEEFDIEYEGIVPEEDFIIEHDDELYTDDIDEDDMDNEILDEFDIEWTSSEVTAYAHKDEVEITYQFGIVQDTGDGVLRRVNRIVTTEDELIEDESNFVFSKEEASTIIAMIAKNMDSLSEFDFDRA
jgi:hypothetical protein